jgi:hypothetical protein
MEVEDQADAAEGHGCEQGHVDSPKARITIRQREQQEGWREDHRLRIGDLRMTGEDIRVPPGPVAAREALCEELHLRMEVCLGVPRNGGDAGDPAPRHPGKEHDVSQRDGPAWPIAGLPNRREIERGVGRARGVRRHRLALLALGWSTYAGEKPCRQSAVKHV